MALELEGFVQEVDLAETGERALELLSIKRYDIVFLDVVLPGIDGYQICKTIKQHRGTKDTPVIMLTGKTSPFDRVRGKLAGCNTYMTKPVEREAFGKVVKTYLKQPDRSGSESGYGATRIGASSDWPYLDTPNPRSGYSTI